MPSQNTNRLAPVHAIKKYDMFNSGIPVYAFRSAERLSSAKQWMPRLFVVTQRSLLVARRDKQCMVRRIIPLAELQDVGVEKQRDGSIVFLFRLIDNSQEPDLVVRNLKSLEVASPVEPPAGSPKASLHRPKDIPAYAMDVVDIISACRGEPLLFIPKSEIQPKGLVPLAVLKKPSGYRSPRIRLSDYRFGINESDYGPVDCDSAGGDVAEGDVSFGQLKAAYERFGALQPSSPPSAPASDAEMHSPRVAATVHGSNGSYAFGKFTSLLNPEAGPKSSHEPPASSSAPALRALTQSQSDVRRDVYEVVLRSPDETIGIWFGAEESASSAAPQQRPGVLITHAPRPDSAADRAGFPHHGWVVSVNNHNVADMPELLELMEHMRSDGVLVYRFLVEVPFSTVTAFDDRQPSCRTSPSATPQFRETAFSALRRSTPGITTPNPELKETYINNVSDTATTLNAPQAMSASRQSTLHLPPPQLNRPTERFSPAPSNTSEGIWKKTSRLDVTASGHLAVPATFASQAPATAWQPTVMWQKGSDAGSVESAARAPLTLPPAGPHPAPMLGPSVERQGWLSSMVAPIPGAQPLSFYDVHGLVPAHVLASGGLAQLLQQHPAGVGVYPELFAAVEVLSVEVQQAAGYVAGAPMEIYNSHTPIMTLVPSTKLLLLGRWALYVLSLNGDMDRCIPLKSVAECLKLQPGVSLPDIILPQIATTVTDALLTGAVTQGAPWLAMKTTGQHDVLVTPLRNAAAQIDQLTDALTRVVSMVDTPPRRLSVGVVKATPDAKLLELFRPAGYSTPWVPLPVCSITAPGTPAPAPAVGNLMLTAPGEPLPILAAARTPVRTGYAPAEWSTGVRHM